MARPARSGRARAVANAMRRRWKPNDCLAGCASRILKNHRFVAEALASARGHIIAVVGYLANEGAHATEICPP